MPLRSPISGNDNIPWPGQGSLFGVDGRKIIMPALTDEQPPEYEIVTDNIGPNVDTRVRAGLLLKTLGLIAEYNRLEGLDYIVRKQSGKDHINDQYGGESGRVVRRSSKKLSSLPDMIEEVFRDAYELGGNMADPEDGAYAKAYFWFKLRFFGARNKSKLDQYRKNLEIIEKIEGPVHVPKSWDVVQSVQPENNEDDENMHPGDAELLVGDKLTRVRLHKINQFQGQGILPSTHQEKNDAFRIISNADRGYHRGAIHNWLQAIKNSSIRMARKNGRTNQESEEAGAEAIKSKMYEYGGYIEDGLSQVEALINLEMNLAEYNDSEPISADLIMQNWAGFAAVTRQVDLMAVMEGRARLNFDPLRTREDRSLPPGSDRHKIIRDPYCIGKPEVDDHIREIASQLKSKEALRILRAAQITQFARIQFWEDALRDVSGKDAIAAQKILVSSFGIEEL